MMKKEGKLVILSGPSGTGKSTIVSQVMQERDDICFSISATTRSPRPGETDGREYFFVDEERFQQMIQNDELLEYAQYVSHYYGTPRAFIQEKLSLGMTVILDIEVQGAAQVKEKFPDAISIFVLPPSIDELRSRLQKRGTDSEQVIEARIRRAKEEIAQAGFYQYMIINDRIENAAREFSSILTAEQCRFDQAKAMNLIYESEDNIL